MIKQQFKRFVFLVLISLFFLPFLLAWFSYTEHWSLSKKHNNYGTLITPPFSIKELLPTYQTETLRGKWLVLLVYLKPCTALCQKSLYFIRQIRLATGGDSDRIERAILTNKENSSQTLMTILQHAFPGTIKIQMDQNQFETVIKKEIPHSALARASGVIYLVDPNGNVMMFYPPEADPKGLFKDLQRLLKVSQIG